LLAFKDLTICQVNNGASTLFWHDSWLAQPLKWQLPHLFSFAKHEFSSATHFLNLQTLEDLGEHFHLPLSEEAFSELLQLQAILLNFPSNMVDDTWLAFNSATSFKVSKAYQHIVGTRDVCPLFKGLWKSCCQHKHKVFFWLILKDRLNTRELLQRKNLFLPDYSCAVCERSSIESGLHLFFQCPFALLCWRYLCPSWQPPAPSPHIQPKDYIMSLKLTIA
jgi:hypothetical protein